MSESFSFKSAINQQYEDRVKATAPIKEVDAYVFCTSSKYLGERLFPTQSLLIKVLYGLWKKYPITKAEQEVLDLLKDEWSIDWDLPNRDINQFIEILILVLGRRAGKSSFISFVQTYETYKLICKGDPQAYYKIRKRHPIWIVNIAKDGAQAQDPFRLCKDNIRRVPFFEKYVDWSKDTSEMLRLFTPADLYENSRIKKFNDSRPKGAPKKNYLEGSIMIAAFTTSAASKRGKAIICVKGDTILFTENGMEPIKNIVPFTNIGVQEKNIKLFGSMGPKTTSKVMCSGKSSGVTIKTKLGFKLTGTPEHKIKCMSKDGEVIFKRLDELKEGDWTYIQKDQNYFGSNIDLPFTPTYPIRTSYKDVTIPSKMSKELARILGYLVAEGFVKYPRYFMFANKNIEVIEDFVHCVRHCFPDVHISQKIKKSGCYKVEISSKKIREFLKHIGLSLTIHNKKEIPWSILQSPKEYVAEFIKAYFEGDGCVAIGTGKYQGQLYALTTSQRLAHQLQIVLLNFGIVASKRMHKSGGYLVVINGISDILKYAKQIGMQSTYRNKRLNIILQKNSTKKSIPKKYRIPNIKIKLRKLYELNLKKAYKMFNNKPNLNDRECIGMASVKRVLDNFKEYSNTNEYKKIQDIFNFSKNIIWDKVVKKEISKDCLMFDVEVPNTHDFLSNGFISHNCLILDEFAHFERPKSIGGGSTDEDIISEMPQTDYAMLKALSPSVKDFNIPSENIMDGKIIMISSPREKGGEFYKNYCIAGGPEQTAHVPLNNKYLLMQLSSWESNPKYSRADFDSDYVKDPVGANMEFGAHFGEPSTSFIDAEKIDEMIKDHIHMSYTGQWQRQYIISVDPASKSDTYAVTWGHVEKDVIIVDGIQGFRAKFVHNKVTNKIIQIPVKVTEVVKFIKSLAANLSRQGILLEIVFDQWNSSSSITELKNAGYVALETFFTNKYKTAMYTNFLEKMNAGKVHCFSQAPQYLIEDAPPYTDGWLEQMKLELKYLTKTTNGDVVKFSHPHSGPIQTDDFADTLANLVYRHGLYLSGDPKIYKALYKQTGRPIKHHATRKGGRRISGLFSGKSTGRSIEEVMKKLSGRIGKNH